MMEVDIRGREKNLQDTKRASGRSSGKRIITLSRPKTSKAIWLTSFEPKLVWGNQEPMWPLKAAALKSEPSERTVRLSTPKTNWQLASPEKCSRPEFVYSCGRSSVIWEVSPVAMKASTSGRTEQLARAKQLPGGYTEDWPVYVLGCGRSSPIQEVSAGAKSAEERPRTLALAAPKRTHYQFQPARDVEWPVSLAARKARTTMRLEHLSNPKDRKDGAVRDPQWAVRKTTLEATASARVQELSRPKPLTDGYLPNRDVEWRVSRSALRSQSSQRIQELAKPTVRDAMDHVQFNPDAFRVSESAKKARITQRINELARPKIPPGPSPKR